MMEASDTGQRCSKSMSRPQHDPPPQNQFTPFVTALA